MAKVLFYSGCTVTFQRVPQSHRLAALIDNPSECSMLNDDRGGDQAAGPFTFHGQLEIFHTKS